MTPIEQAIHDMRIANLAVYGVIERMILTDAKRYGPQDTKAMLGELDLARAMNIEDEESDE